MQLAMKTVIATLVLIPLATLGQPATLTKQSRRALVIPNPYAQPSANQYGQSVSSNTPSTIPVPMKLVSTRPAQTRVVQTATQQSINPYMTASSFVTPIDPKTLTSNQSANNKQGSTVYSNGQSVTTLDTNAFNALQVRTAASTLEAPPTIGNKIVDQLFQRANSFIGGFGNTANTLIGVASNVSTKAINNKDYLTQQESALSTGNFANTADFANKVNQINTNYDAQMQSITTKGTKGIV